MAFGVPGGGPNLDMVGAFGEFDIDFVLAHSETAACIMATTWGWLTDGLAVAIATRGPGAASAVNGAAQATLDRQPLLLVTDTVPGATRDRVPHQRIDQQAMLAPVVKATGVLGSATTTRELSAAVALATTAPAGCVHLDYDTSLDGTSVVSTSHSDAGIPSGEDVVESARAVIASAERPVVILGIGAIADADVIRAALAHFGAPVLTTYQAIGLLPTVSPLCAGLFTNGASERPLLDQADLIVTIGLDVVEPIPAPWTYEANVVSFATMPTVDPYLPHVIEVIGDLGVLVPESLGRPTDWAPDVGGRHRTAVCEALAEGESSDVLGPVALTKTLVENTPNTVTITVDAGAHFLAIMPFWPVEQSRRLLISNGLATMGYAVPAAIGAALARPDEPVVALTGDGGLCMCLSELETIVRRGLPVLTVVFNDAALSLIEIKQQQGHGGRGAVRYDTIDFAATAGAMGMRSATARDLAELKAALAAHDFASPMLIDARIDASSYRHLLAVTRGG